MFDSENALNLLLGHNGAASDATDAPTVCSTSGICCGRILRTWSSDERVSLSVELHNITVYQAECLLKAMIVFKSCA